MLMGQVPPDMYTALSEPWHVRSAITCTESAAKGTPTVAEIRLSIDGIYLTVDLPEQITDRILEFIHEIPETSKSVPAFPFHRWHRRDYTAGFKAYLNDLLAWSPVGAGEFVCETGAKREGAKNTRFRWNPAKCDSQTVAAIVFCDYLGVSPSCLLPATVSRIDVALDIPYVRVDDIAVSYPKMRLIENRFSGGRTMYLGARSGRTRVVVYDKAAEMQASNSKLGGFLADLHEAIPPHDLLRLEIRHQSAVKFMSLPDLPNLFMNLRVYDDLLDTAPLYRVTLALARYEGFPRAIQTAGFGESQQKAFLRRLKKAGQVPWWKPLDVWDQQYQPTITQFMTPFTKYASHSDATADSSHICVAKV
jgi:hypothetical protein